MISHVHKMFKIFPVSQCVHRFLFSPVLMVFFDILVVFVFVVVLVVPVVLDVLVVLDVPVVLVV